MVLELEEKRFSSTFVGFDRYPSTGEATAAAPPAAGIAAVRAALAATTSGGAACCFAFAAGASGAKSYMSSPAGSSLGGGGRGILITYPQRHLTFFPIHSGLGTNVLPQFSHAWRALTT
jgi:hypothetical protein